MASDNDKVSISREEFDALMVLKETNAENDLKHAQLINRNHDMMATCNAQAKRLIEIDLSIQHYERVIALQRILNDMLRADYPVVAALEDLSRFWQQWNLVTNNLVNAQPQQRGAVAELTPDLFRSWSLWVRDSGRHSRSFSVAGTTRAEVDGDRLALSQMALQDRIIEQQRAQTAALTAQVKELEGVIEAYKAGRKSRAP